MLKKLETVLNNSPPTTKESVATPKKLLKFLSQFQTSNLSSKVYSPLLIQENLKLDSSVTEIKLSETNNNTTKLNSPKDYLNSTPSLKLLTSSYQNSEELKVKVKKKKLSSNFLRLVRVTQLTLYSKSPSLLIQDH